jgi:hypothetical protein
MADGDIVSIGISKENRVVQIEYEDCMRDEFPNYILLNKDDCDLIALLAKVLNESNTKINFKNAK